MAERVAYLYPGDLIVCAEPCTVNTIVGSCVAVFLWDARRRLGGVNHFLLPRDPRPREPSPRFGSTAMRDLIERLTAAGSDVPSLVAKVFGGANVLGAPPRGEAHLGLQNADLAFETLRELRVPVLASDVGGHRGRRIVCHTADGSAWVKEL